MHGHFDAKNPTFDLSVPDQRPESEDRSVNTGIGIVVPIHKVLEAIEFYSREAGLN